MPTAYIAIGSNLGDRERALDDAVRLLVDETGARSRRSPLYETEPVGYRAQPRFLNGVVELTGALPSPHALLDLCLSIERRLGRERTVPNGPRTVDLDLLLYDDLRVDDEGLTLPHPRMHERAFVLVPLADLAPHARHPILDRSIAELLAALDDTSM